MNFRKIDHDDLETRVVIQAAILLIAIVGLIGLSLAWGGDPGVHDNNENRYANSMNLENLSGAPFSWFNSAVRPGGR